MNDSVLTAAIMALLGAFGYAMFQRERNKSARRELDIEKKNHEINMESINEELDKKLKEAVKRGSDWDRTKSRARRFLESERSDSE